MPADSYYADVNGDWNDLPDFLPSDVELMLGRVDLFNMPGVGAASPWPSEIELLRNYLNKDHNWRHNLLSVPAASLMGNLRGDEQGEATAASGYRNLNRWSVRATPSRQTSRQRMLPLNSVGLRCLAANLPVGLRLRRRTTAACSGLGTNGGSFYEVRSTDVVGVDAHCRFRHVVRELVLGNGMIRTICCELSWRRRRWV